MITCFFIYTIFLSFRKRYNINLIYKILYITTRKGECILKTRTILIAITAYGLLCTASIYTYTQQIANPVISNVGRLLPTKIKRVENVEDEQTLKQLVKDANASGERISIAGMQHSQGGQTYYPNGTVLDMKGYNKIVEFDPEKKRIRVQSGVTWEAEISKE